MFSCNRFILCTVVPIFIMSKLLISSMAALLTKVQNKTDTLIFFRFKCIKLNTGSDSKTKKLVLDIPTPPPLLHLSLLTLRKQGGGGKPTFTFTKSQFHFGRVPF